MILIFSLFLFYFREYLTGFQKRRKQRQKVAQIELEKKARDKKLEERRMVCKREEEGGKGMRNKIG